MDSARNPGDHAQWLSRRAGLDQLSNRGVGWWHKVFPPTLTTALWLMPMVTQRLPQLFEGIARGYFSYTAAGKIESERAIWCSQMMDSAEKGKAFEQAIMPAQMLSQIAVLLAR